MQPLSTNFWPARPGNLMYWQWILLLFPLLLLTPATAQVSWGQLGREIDGEAMSDNAGRSVALSLDGTRVAVGAPGNNGNGPGSGHVRVFAWNGSAWIQQGAAINGETAANGSGFSVSLSSDGSRVAIGVLFNNSANGMNTGHVRIFAWNGNAWVQQGADIDGKAAGDFSGRAVSLSADGMRVAIGAPGEGPNAIGYAAVYAWNGSTWVQQGADIIGEAVGDQSGRSVSLSPDGTRVAIGAPFNDANGSNSGHVRVYAWNGSAWIRQGADIDGEAAGDISGRWVSISSDGTRVAIGAPLNDGNGNNSGHVRVFSWSGSAWAQLGADIDGEESGNQSGVSVALSTDGTRLAIGAPNNSGVNGSNSGHVRIYGWNGSAWVQQGADIDGEADGDASGESVSLSADGTRVAIGAALNDGNGNFSGHVRVYGACPAVPVACTTPTTNIVATNIRLFPNPTTGLIQLGDIQPDRVAVCDYMGRLMIQIEKPGDTLDLAGLPMGMYFLKLMQGKVVYVARMVLEGGG